MLSNLYKNPQNLRLKSFNETIWNKEGVNKSKEAGSSSPLLQQVLGYQTAFAYFSASKQRSPIHHLSLRH